MTLNQLVSTRPQALTALRDIVRALSSAVDLDSTLHLIAQKTTDIMHVDACNIYLTDEDGVHLRLKGTTGLNARALGRGTLRVGEGMTGYAVATQRPVFAAIARRNPNFKQVAGSGEENFQSLLAVPLLVEDEAIGALNVQTVEKHEYSQDEIEVLSLIAEVAAGALAKAKLYDEQQRQLKEMRTLATVSEAVTSPQFLDDVLNLVTELAAQTMKAAVCSIFLLDENSMLLELRSAKRTTSEYGQRLPLPLGVGIIGQVAQMGEPRYVADVRESADYLGSERARQEGLVSLLSVPLSVRDRVIGVLNCYTDAPRQFTTEQQAFFLTLANQTALSIENSRLATNAAVMKEMHHRIKNNLQTVAMLMQLQIPEAEKLDTRTVLETNIHRIRSIATVHEILSERGFNLVDVKLVLEQIVRETAVSLLPNQQNIRLNVVGEGIQLPSQAATALALVINELVQNALEHAFPEQQTGRVDVSLGSSPEQFIVLVRDDGVGIPVENQHGLGLEIVGTLVQEDLRGTIRYKRPSEGGTEISIRFPRRIEE